MKRAALALALAASSTMLAAQTVIVYSSTDGDQAERVRQLVGALDDVFIARDLAGGVAWRQAIALRICTARRVLVVWSARAAASVEVGAEWRLAAVCGVPLVAVMLDSTPLPAELGQLQAVDWR